MAFHVQQAIGEYTTVIQRNRKTIIGNNLALSQAPPNINAPVTVANIPWKTANTISGNEEIALGAPSTSLKPKNSRVPVKPLEYHNTTCHHGSP